MPPAARPPTAKAAGPGLRGLLLDIGGVVHSKFDGYRLQDQWTSYGWNVFSIPDGHDYDQILGVLTTMESWDPGDRRPRACR